MKNDICCSENIFNKKEFLALIDDNIDLYNELIIDFRKSFNELFDKLKSSFKENNFEQIIFYSHTIKGMSINIRAAGIKQIAENIELFSKTNSDIKKIECNILALENAYNEFLSILDKD